MDERIIYIHTLDGMPAEFDPVQRQIVEFTETERALRACGSLAEVEEQQRITRETRLTEHALDMGFEYGFVCVGVPDESDQ